MNHTLLSFVQSILTELKVSSRICPAPFEWEDSSDYKLRQSIYNPETDYAAFCRNISGTLQYIYQNTTLCWCTDRFRCEYIFLKLPDTPVPSLYIIGPFTYTAFTTNSIIELCRLADIPGTLLDFMQQFYYSLPVVTDERWMESLICTLARELWNDGEITIQHLSDIDHAELHPQYYSAAVVPTPNTLTYMEEKYKSEDVLMAYISTGDLENLDRIRPHLRLSAIKQHFTDSLRDQKNNLVIFNTVCRKAAQYGGVHPVYLDAEFNKYALRIEYGISLKQLDTLFREIPRKYCMLVHSYSLKDYSTTIQNVITYINFHLAEDLWLHTIAEHFSLNKNYLSTLFKRETGSSLTAFVNQKRINHALYLLNTTLLPIQNIAESCGIPDFNYFSRIFKLQVGRSPSQYRKEVKHTADDPAEP